MTNTPKYFSVKILLCLLLIGGFSPVIFAQTSAFTYQGRLTDGAQAANGTYEMEFRLFGSLNGADQINSTITNNNVQVLNGIFTVNLNFGANAFAGADRFLEISVKKPAESAFTTLLPRQQIASSPYSLKTVSATFADSLSGACVGCVDDAKIASVSGAKVTGAVANAVNATDSAQLGGVAANQYALANDARLTDTRTPTNGSVTTAKFATTPHCRARQTAVQTIPGGSLSTVRLDETTFCSGVTFQDLTDRMVIVTPGVYLITAEIAFAPNLTGVRRLSIDVPGDNTTSFVPALNSTNTVSATTLIRLSAPQSVSLQVGQTSGVDLNTAFISGHSASLSIVWVGP